MEEVLVLWICQYLFDEQQTPKSIIFFLLDIMPKVDIISDCQIVDIHPKCEEYYLSYTMRL